MSFRFWEVLGHIARTLQGKSQLRRHEGESTGQFGERLAADYLAKKRYRIIARNEKNLGGEIDLIAVQTINRQRVIVFVEVKSWASAKGGGGPSDAVDDNKQARLTNAANVYLRRHRLLEHRSRLDVIEVILKNNLGETAIRHFENAFEASR